MGQDVEPADQELLPGATEHDRAGEILRRILRGDDTADLDQALMLLRFATTREDVPDLILARRFHNLATAHFMAFERSGHSTELQASIEARQRSIALTPHGDPALATRLSALAEALRHRYEWYGEAADLGHAIDLGRHAVEVAGQGRRLPGAQSNLGTSLRLRYEADGDPSDIDEAIANGRAAVAATPADDGRLAARQSNLSISLRDRYLARGAVDDLEEAISAITAAVEATPPSHPQRAGRLSNLGLCLRSRHIRRREGSEENHAGSSRRSSEGDEDIDQAVAAFREAVALAGSADLGWRLKNLAAALLTKFESSGTRTELDEAVQVARQAIGVPTTKAAQRPLLQNDLAFALTHAAAAHHAPALAKEAIDIGEAVLSGTPRRSVNRAMLLVNIGLAQRVHFDLTREPSSASAAIEAWREASESTTSSTRDRIAAAMHWAQFAQRADIGDDIQIAGFIAAIDLLPVLAWRGLDRRSREGLLASLPELCNDAVSCAVAAKRADLALQFEEAGRATLWSQLLDQRADLSALTDEAPSLARRLIEVQTELEAMDAGRIPAGSSAEIGRP